MENKKITLRSISEHDLEWARNLRNNNREFFFDNKFISREQQEEWYKKLNYPFFIIEYNGNPVGTIAVKELGEKLEVDNVLIDKFYRKKGILRQVINIIKNIYKRPLYIDVKVDNKIAIKAYEKLGFSAFSYKMKKG